MDIKERLLQLGISVAPEQEEAVLFAQNKTEEHIKNVCNIDCIPDELMYLAIDMACGEYLKDRLLSGMEENFDVNGALKAITEGDVRLEYSSEQSGVDTLLNILNRGEEDLYRFRRLSW